MRLMRVDYLKVRVLIIATMEINFGHDLKEFFPDSIGRLFLAKQVIYHFKSCFAADKADSIKFFN